MERRNFIQKSAIGIAGFNLLGVGSSSALLLHTKAVHDWFHQFVRATSLKKSSGLFIAGELSDVIKALNLKFAKRGFKSLHSCYFYPGREDYCLYALELNHTASGMSDIMIPVMHKEEDGTWNHFTTINGYQLEALVKSIPILESQSQSIGNLILPVKKSCSYTDFGYAAKNAHVQMMTRIGQGQKIMTSISVTDRNTTHFQEVFESGHCLTSSNTGV